MFCFPCWSIRDVLCYVLFHCHVLVMAWAYQTSHECFLVRKFSERLIWIHQTTSVCKNWRSRAIVTKGQWLSMDINNHIPLVLNEGCYHLKLFVVWWGLGSSEGSMIFCPLRQIWLLEFKTPRPCVVTSSIHFNRYGPTRPDGHKITFVYSD